VSATAPAPPEPAKTAKLPRSERRHRWLVATLLTLAVITGLIAILSTYVRRQALDTNNFVNTSSKFLADKNIQNALGTFMVNELFSSVDVKTQLQGALPPQAQALAGPASAGLRELAGRAAPELLARPRVQAAWQQANRAAHKQLLTILNGGGNTVSTQNGEVVLNLHNLVDQLATNLGLSRPNPAAGQQARGVAQDKLGVTLPASSGQIVVMRAKQLKTAQDIAKLVRHISIIFTVLFFVCLAGAIALASGWRRIALRSSGWCFVGLGIAVLLVRRVAGNEIVNGLVNAESVKPAAHDAWNIGTSLLRAIAIAFVIYGLVIVVAAWLAGPTNGAVALRRALTPTFRDHPVRTYSVAGILYLLVLLWGPTPALRQLIPILLIAALLVLGIEILRRQAIREFPDEQSGDAMLRMRTWWQTRRHHGAVTNGQQPPMA
jgi:hypothetical protein